MLPHCVFLLIRWNVTIFLTVLIGIIFRNLEALSHLQILLKTHTKENLKEIDHNNENKIVDIGKRRQKNRQIYKGVQISARVYPVHTDSLQYTTRVERTLQRKRWRNTPKFFRPSEIWWKKGPSSLPSPPPPPSPLLPPRFLSQPFRGFSSATLGGIRKGLRKKEIESTGVFFHGGIMRRIKGMALHGVLPSLAWERVARQVWFVP